MEKKKIIIVAVALIALVAILAGAAAALLHNNDSYASRISQGYRYLEAGDFNNAILEFRYAIEEDGTREDAYYGLYQAYLHSGQEDLAVTTLRVGVANSGGARLEQIIVDGGYQTSNGGPEQGSAGHTQPSGEEDKNVEAILNTDLLTLFASASYGDYCMRYDSTAGSYEGAQYTKYLSALGITLIYRDSSTERVIDAGRGVPYNQFLPTEIKMDNVMSLFGGISRLSYDSLQRLSGLSGVSRAGNTITISYPGCEITIICGEDGIITADCEHTIVPTGVTIQESIQHSLSATVVDATTGRALSGAKIKIYKSSGGSGEVQEATTGSDGNIVFDLEESGTYTLEIKKSGYISETFEVYILSNLQQTQQSFALAPVPQSSNSEEIRLVLTWGSAPSDLDCHLVGTADDGTSVHLYYGNQVKTDSRGDKIAVLDVDDTSGHGPETVTIFDTEGTYEFYIDDFTNSNSISASGATVKIYVGSSLYATVNITSGIADKWHVCTISNGNITVTNRSY